MPEAIGRKWHWPTGVSKRQNVCAFHSRPRRYHWLIMPLFLLVWFLVCIRIEAQDLSGIGDLMNNTRNGIDSSSTNCERRTEVAGQLAGVENQRLNASEQGGGMKVLSRNKRYVAFPEGSSFSVAFCATLGFVGNPSFIYFSWAINWGLAYELPNQTWILNNQDALKRPLPRPVVLRRHRRELYGRLETAIDNMGYDGRQCILRALCESTQYFYKQGSNMVEELLRSIFSLPRTKVLSFEHADLLEYDAAHRRGQNRAVCPAAYPACGMSLIEMALGEYSRQSFAKM